MPRSAHRLLFAVVLTLGVSSARAEPVRVDLVQRDGNWMLLRGGEPYAIKGAGGDGSKAALRQAGANSFRTWGVDASTGALLDEAQRLGMTVTVGIWLGHERHGFDYGDADAVRRQFDDARKWVEQYKDHPALLMWAVGNEMEGDGNNAAVWLAVEQIAAMIQQADPDHPVMTVIAELGGHKVKLIHALCPSVDVVGINSYGGASSVPERYRKAGGTKPYVITEYGPPGTWEMERNEWGAARELTSTEKADWYARGYRAAAEDQQLGLGSYAFTWGNKQEGTATWYGLLLADGSQLGAVDELTKLWTGEEPADHAPRIKSMKVVGLAAVGPGATVEVKLDVTDPDGDAMQAEWRLARESFAYQGGGDAQAAARTYPDAIVASGVDGATVTMPANGGGYRLFAYVRDGRGKAATANLPLKVDAPQADEHAAAAKLPYTVFGDDQTQPTYYPSGWMGEAADVSMAEKHAGNPHAGSTCLRFTYAKADGWAGVVWQSPANDWGDQAGGLDLSGAGKLTFWARGETGGETLKVGMGLIGRDKKYYDTAKAEKQITLTREWAQFTVDLADRDLSRIKTPFYWTVAGQGAPVTFYLDDIRYE